MCRFFELKTIHCSCLFILGSVFSRLYEQIAKTLSSTPCVNIISLFEEELSTRLNETYSPIWYIPFVQQKIHSVFCWVDRVTAERYLIFYKTVFLRIDAKCFLYKAIYFKKCFSLYQLWLIRLISTLILNYYQNESMYHKHAIDSELVLYLFI